MLLSRVFVDWCPWQFSLATGHLTSLIDKILQQVALIFGQEKDLGLLNNITKVSHKVTAFFRELG